MSELVYNLKKTKDKVGCLYPVLLSEDGEIIDGAHRLRSDKDWPTIKLPIKGRKQVLRARIVANGCRRNVEQEEKTVWVSRLADILLEEGIQKKDLVKTISQETGMSGRWVYKYLPRRYKEQTRPPKQFFEIERRAIPANEPKLVGIYLDPKIVKIIETFMSSKGLPSLEATVKWLIEYAIDNLGLSSDFSIKNIKPRQGNSE